MSKITILIPAYNAEKYISQTIDSILNQTFRDFEVLIIDDGSTDNTEKIIKSYQDSRIIYDKNPKNLKITKTLNRGLAKINSEYIVRMDADDIMEKNKLEKQIQFMDSNPEIAISGTRITKFYEDDTQRKINIPKNFEEVKTHLLFDSPLMHPTVIMRNNVIMHENYRYQERYIGLEDYGLWFEISKKYKLSNINESLLYYRVSESSITQTLSKDLEKYNESYYILIKEMFDELNITYSNIDIRNWRKFILGTLNLLDKAELDSLINITKQLKNKIQKLEFYNIRYFDKQFTKYLRKNSKNLNLNSVSFIKLLKNEFQFLSIDYIELIKYVMK